MKPIVSMLLGVLMAGASAVYVQAQSATQIENPNSMFGGAMVGGDSSATANRSKGNAGGAQASAAPPTVSPLDLLKSNGVDFGGNLYSDFTTSAYWQDGYPVLSGSSPAAATSFVPNLEADLYFDARPYSYFRVYGKFRAVYPFGSASQGVYQMQTNPLSSIYSAPPAPNIPVPNLSVFELFADVNWNERLFLRVGQQVINWGVGYFFSPADILSLTPINPLEPTLERQGPLALTVSLPFAGVDTAYLYVIANQAFARSGTFYPSDLAIAPKVNFVLGGYEFGVGGYYQKNQSPEAMATVTGSLFGKLGVFGEAVVSRGTDRTLVEPVPGSPGSYQAYTDTTTPFFSGTIGTSYANSVRHVAVYLQYFYNGPGYTSLAAERGAVSLYESQQSLLSAGSQPAGPILSPTDLLQLGRNYLAGLVSWSDIHASNIDLRLFYEGNLSDGSGVVGPSVSYTPFSYFTIAFAPYLGYGASGSQFVTKFGYLGLSLKVSIGEGSF